MCFVRTEVVLGVAVTGKMCHIHKIQASLVLGKTRANVPTQVPVGSWDGFTEAKLEGT